MKWRHGRAAQALLRLTPAKPWQSGWLGLLWLLRLWTPFFFVTPGEDISDCRDFASVLLHFSVVCFGCMLVRLGHLLVVDNALWCEQELFAQRIAATAKLKRTRCFIDVVGQNPLVFHIVLVEQLPRGIVKLAWLIVVREGHEFLGKIPMDNL